MPLHTLNIVGAGRVGQTLAHQWHQRGVFAVQDVLTRSNASALAACTRIGAGAPQTALSALRFADVWMLAIPDAELPRCAAALAAVQTAQAAPERPVIVFHCSGALGSEVLAPLAALGWLTASAHCLLSFAQIDTALAQFAGTPCALEGNATACERLQQAFAAIGAQCFALAGSDKLLYHAAAVFATNFLPVLQATAEDLWARTGMPPPLVAHARTALLRNAVANITTLGPQAALTGPAARGDRTAIERQGAAVAQWDPDAGAAYAALSALALRLASKKNSS